MAQSIVDDTGMFFCSETWLRTFAPHGQDRRDPGGQSWDQSQVLTLLKLKPVDGHDSVTMMKLFQSKIYKQLSHALTNSLNSSRINQWPQPATSIFASWAISSFHLYRRPAGCSIWIRTRTKRMDGLITRLEPPHSWARDTLVVRKINTVHFLSVLSLPYL
jgi:hypothetical protein